MNLAQIDSTGFRMGFYWRYVEACCNQCSSVTALNRPLDERLLNAILSAHRTVCDSKARVN